MLNSGELAAKSLADKIKTGKLKSGFTLRDVYRKGWANLTSQSDANEALEILTENGWIISYQQETLGRTKLAYRINPKIKKREG